MSRRRNKYYDRKLKLQAVQDILEAVAVYGLFAKNTGSKTKSSCGTG